MPFSTRAAATPKTVAFHQHACWTAPLQINLALENEPIRIRGRSLLDPLVLASEIKGRRVVLMEDMQGVLEATQGEQRVLKSDFLERCLKRI